MTRRSSLLVPVVVLVAGAVLMGSIAFAVNLPSTRVLFRGSPESLDYRFPQSQRLDGLSSSYIAQVLGLPLEQAGGPDGAAGAGLPFPGTGVGAFPAGAESRRVVVDHPFDNDAFEQARDVPSLPFTARTDTTGASRQAGEPTDCSAVGGTAWYRYRPLHDMTVFANTFGTDYADALGIYSGSSLASLRSLSCSTGATGNAQLRVDLNGGDTYYVQVTGPVRGGHLVLNVDLVGPTMDVMVSSGGEKADRAAFSPTPMSANGRFVAFTTDADNLVDGTQCPEGRALTCMGLYLKDMQTGRLRLVTWSRPDSAAGCCTTYPGGLSANGRFLTFYSDAPNVIKNRDPNRIDTDVYTYDRRTGRIELDSVSSAGALGLAPAESEVMKRTQVNGTGAFYPSISADGRYVAFESDYTNLVRHDTNGVGDVFVHDRVTGRTTRVSVRSDGEQLNDWGELYWNGQAISADGRYVAFHSYATNIGRNTTSCSHGCVGQVFVHDRRTGRTTLVSRPRAGRADGDSEYAAISADGHHVGFISAATDLVAHDTNGSTDYFEWSAGTGRVERVSVSSTGAQQEQSTNSSTTSNYGQQNAGTTISISADGRLTCFDSNAVNLVPGVATGFNLTYIHDRRTGATTLASITDSGVPQGRNAFRPLISADGNAVAYDLDHGSVVQNNITPGEVLEHWLP